MDYERLTILLVQQNVQTAAIIGYRLQLLGYEVTTVQSGEEVPAATERQVPNLVIVEKRLPGIDGTEVVSQLRSNEQSKDVSVLMCSLDSSNEAIRAAFVAGADDYLLLPFDPATLEYKVETLLNGTPAEKVRG